MHIRTPLLILAETAVRSSVAQDTVAMVTMTTRFLALQGWEREKNAWMCVWLWVCACVSVENKTVAKAFTETQQAKDEKLRRGEQQHILM